MGVTYCIMADVTERNRRLMNADKYQIKYDIITISWAYLTERFSYRALNSTWDRYTYNYWMPKLNESYWGQGAGTSTHYAINMTTILHEIIEPMKLVPIINYTDHSSYQRQVNTYFSYLRMFRRDNQLREFTNSLIDYFETLVSGETRDAILRRIMGWRAASRGRNKLRRAVKGAKIKAIQAFRDKRGKESGVCPLCQEPPTLFAPLVKTCKVEGCKDRFHRECFNEYLDHCNNSCPVCRRGPCQDPDLASPDIPNLKRGDIVLARTPKGFWYFASVCDYNRKSRTYKVKFLENFVGTFQQFVVHVSSYNLDSGTKMLRNQEDIETVYGRVTDGLQYGVNITTIDFLGHNTEVHQDNYNSLVTPLDREPILDDDPDL